MKRERDDWGEKNGCKNNDLRHKNFGEKSFRLFIGWN